MILSFLRAEVRGSFEDTYSRHFSKKKQTAGTSRCQDKCQLSHISDCFVSGENVRIFWNSKKGLRLDFWILCIEGVDEDHVDFMRL